MNVDSERISSLANAHGRVSISACGLAITFASVLVAFQHGILSPLGAAIAWVIPFTLGLAIAAAKRWQLLACVAVVGTLLGILFGPAAGVSGAFLFAGLIAVVITATLLCWYVRWIWPIPVVLAAPFVLAGWSIAATASPIHVLAGLIIAWICGSLASFMLHARGQTQFAPAVAVLAVLGPLLAAVVSFHVGTLVLGVAAMLVLTESVFVHRLNAASSATGRILTATGLALLAWTLVTWIDGPMLAPSLGVLACALWVVAARFQSRIFAGLAALEVLCEWIVMATTFPYGPAQSWEPQLWSAAALIVAGQLTTMTVWWQRRSRVPSLPRWAAGTFVASSVVCAVAALSTELTSLFAWTGVLNVLWTGIAILLWRIGWQKRELRLLGLVLLCASVGKLLLLDWQVFDPATRVILLAVSGGCLLVGPVLLPFDLTRYAARHRFLV